MKNKKVHCAVDYAFQRIGGKYKGRILWVLRAGVLRYGELNRAVIGITPKMLTQTLKELEADELIVKVVFASYVVPFTGELMFTVGAVISPAVTLFTET